MSTPPRLAADPATRLSPSDGPRVDLGFDLASAVVGAIVLVLIAATFTDYGITWDETWHLNYGRHVIHWYASLFEDTSALTYRADYLYGGSFDALGYLARQISPFGNYETIHLFGAMIGCLGLLGTWKLGRLLGGAAGGFASLVLLVLTPVWYGHMFNNPKDLPFAVGYVWAIYYEIRILICLPAVPRREWVKASIALGAAMSVRIAGLLTLCYLFMLVGLWIAWQARQARDARLIPRYLLRFSPALLFTSLGAWALMLVFWPWAQLAPLRRPLITLARMSKFNLHERGMPFGVGRRISTLNPPPDYLLRYFYFKLPELILIVVTIALVLLFVRLAWLRERSKAERAGRVLAKLGPIADDERRRLAISGFLAFVILFPPVYAASKQSPLYDGLRHFLFLVPLLAMIAGVGLAQVGRRVVARSRLAFAGYAALLVGHCVRMVLMMAHLHPHQYLGFNQFVGWFKGGLPGAFLRYSTDYYGNTYKEGFETLREHLWETERERYLAGPYVVSACMPGFIAREYLGTNFELEEKGGPPAEFWLGYTRNNCYLKHDEAPELTRVEREDTLLVLIRDLRDPDQRDKVSVRRTERRSSGARRPAKPKSRAKPKPKPKPKPKQKPATKQPTTKPALEPKPKPKSKPPVEPPMPSDAPIKEGP